MPPEWLQIQRFLKVCYAPGTKHFLIAMTFCYNVLTQWSIIKFNSFQHFPIWVTVSTFPFPTFKLVPIFKSAPLQFLMNLSWEKQELREDEICTHCHRETQGQPHSCSHTHTHTHTHTVSTEAREHFEPPASPGFPPSLPPCGFSAFLVLFLTFKAVRKIGGFSPAC